jgi:hypothetical protein|eukprot:COSAG01_NODE_4503_length_4970_cov_90.727161_5_plen_182_part_00
MSCRLEVSLHIVCFVLVAKVDAPLGLDQCPGLRDAVLVGTYSGLRPATEHRDYQILDRGCGWITVAGIRSTGLTASAAIAEYVADLCQHGHGASGGSSGGNDDHGEATLERVTAAAAAPLPLRHQPVVELGPDGGVQPLPTLAQLAEQYQRRGDGTIVLHPGAEPVRVTHCLSTYGMEAND